MAFHLVQKKKKKVNQRRQRIRPSPTRLWVFTVRCLMSLNRFIYIKKRTITHPQFVTPIFNAPEPPPPHSSYVIAQTTHPLYRSPHHQLLPPHVYTCTHTTPLFITMRPRPQKHSYPVPPLPLNFICFEFCVWGVVSSPAPSSLKKK